ncbi:glycosyltransferase family 4 protein [Magnetospirillum sp. SS-4]|uniref:MraY family glycosyltransferase n=1 Tax=Magnetospirillum sp. SS-4 TaxID=2681465 RepID=UPI00137F408C|nr:glycosyltransferase family 4 protein [Magnetospirillum sp. SS-4]CAA7621182.1 UDP-N-acetylmuramyl pentapeptide phosphotransferase [Magnetospirillum sp. SS-4]
MTATALAVGLASFALSVAATRVVLAWLRHRQILDHPNERSSHTLPTPRGGGLAVTPVVAVMLILLAYRTPGYPAVLAAGALILMAVSWLDDRRGLAPLPRFLMQAVVIAAYLLGLEPEQMVFQGGVPLWADRLLTGLGWLWFVNLFNFMDGIDGITGIETAAIGLGLAALGAATTPQALAVAGAGLGFLVWNWHPARIFLGDSGSIPLGFVLGGLLIHLACAGQLAAALILPAYYLADASITLLWRLRDGERIWQAHRRHFYQRAVRGGRSHAQVALAILGGNILLIGCAVLAARVDAAAGSLAALAVVAAMLTLLTRWAGGILR